MKRLQYQSLMLFISSLIIFPVYLFSQNGEQKEPELVQAIQYPAFETFENIVNKNIFNPNRRARNRDERPVERTPDPDENVLTGTMVTENDRFAFFEDVRSGDIAVVSTGNTFLGFEVGKVENNKVYLQKDGVILEVPILMALQKEEGKDWELVSPSGRRSSSSGSSTRESSRRDREGERNSERVDSSSTRDESSLEDSSGSEDVQNEVLKRLLEKRRQESGQ